MKSFLAAMVFAGCTTVSANEDLLLLIPKPVWHDFDIGSHEASETNVDEWMVRISPREVPGAPFREDNLEISLTRKASSGRGIWFSSSYGAGSFAVDGRLVFLRYGIGRGTFAREQHVKIFLIDDVYSLEELADVKVSAYVESPGPGKGDPVLMEYAMRTTREGDATTVTFVPPKAAGVRWPTKVLTIKEGEGKTGS